MFQFTFRQINSFIICWCDVSINHHFECKAAQDLVVSRDSYGWPDSRESFSSMKSSWQRHSLCIQMQNFPVNSCCSGSRFISLQTDRVKNEFRPKLRGMTVWALYLNTKQHSRGHNFQPAGKEANLPISY